MIKYLLKMENEMHFGSAWHDEWYVHLYFVSQNENF